MDRSRASRVRVFGSSIRVLTVVFLGEAFGWEMLIAFASIILGVRLALHLVSEPADTALKSGADRYA